MNLPKFALSHKPIVLGFALVLLAWGLNVFLNAPRREDPEFTWERTDKAEALRTDAGI